MDYMKRQQAFLDETKEKIISAKTTLIGAKIITYEFINEPSKPFFKGKILFEDNEVKDVCFFKSEEARAKKIFAETSNLHNEAILKLWFTTYCEAIESWILCYDKFDHFLGDWVTKKSSRDRMRYADEDLLQSRGCVMIRSLLEGIIYVHNHGLFHKSLNLTTSYVVLSNTIKIINIGMHSLKDLPVPDDATINKLRTDDLMGFKAVLETHILLPDVAWADRDLFFDFFCLTDVVRYDIFVHKLMKHSFLMNSDLERMRSFFDIVHAIELNELPMFDEFRYVLETETFNQYRSWDTGMGDSLRSVYEYEDEKVKRRKYDGQDVMQLLEFLRQAYRHPRENSMEELDSDVRKAYPSLLHRLHKVLCRLERDDD